MKKLQSILIILIFGCVFGIEGRPQMDMDDVFQVDGFSFDGPADRTNPSFPNNRPITTDAPIIGGSSTRSVTTTTTTTTTTSPELDNCTQSCLATSEFNPVCGTDGVVYNNPGRLICAQRCGKDVRLLYYGPCSTSNSRG